MKTSILNWSVSLVFLILAGCGGGGGNNGGGGNPPPPPAPTTFTVGGSVSGLNGKLELQNNGGDDLEVNGTGAAVAFTFATRIANNGAYAVTVKTSPANQNCMVTANGSGPVAGNVTNVAITCTDLPPPPPGFHILSVRVSGLSGTLVLLNNGADELTFDSNTTLRFSQPVQENSAYAVTVKTQPNNQTCTVATGTDTGTMGTSDVTLEVQCTDNPPPPPGQQNLTLSVTGNGLVGGNNVLVRVGHENVDRQIDNNGGVPLGSLDVGTNFTLSIVRQPSFPPANCTFIDNNLTTISGTIVDGEHADVRANCTALPALDTLQAEVRVLQTRVVHLSWTNPRAPVRQFNLLVTTQPNCDFLTCRDDLSDRYFGINHPATFVDRFKDAALKHGQTYYFQIDTMYENGPNDTNSRGLSNKAAALPNAVAFDRPVNAITTAPDGTVYVGGSFRNASLTTGPLVPIDTKTGRRAGVPLPVVAGKVNAILADGAGGYFIGGDYTHIGGMPISNLAHVRADGSVDPSNVFPEGPVNALERVGTTLYVGGKFTLGNSRNVAAINLLNGDVYDWTPNPNDEVHALAFLNGWLFVGGKFTGGGGNRPDHLALFDTDAANGSPLSSAPLDINFRAENSVRAMRTSGRSLYVAGDFLSFDDADLQHVARIDVDDLGTGRVSHTFRPNPQHSDDTVFPSVHAIEVTEAAVFLGGLFDTVGGGNATNLARVDSTTGGIQPLGLAVNSFVTALAASPTDGTLYVGGPFLLASISTNGVARFFDPPSGTHADPVRNVPLASPTVRALAVSGNTLYAGGTFNSMGSVARHSLAALNSQGSLLPWHPDVDAGLDGVVNALAFFFNPFLNRPLVYVGGSFDTIGVPQRNKPNLAAVDALTAEAIGGFAFLGTTNGPVHALAIEPNGGLYVGGQFTTLAGRTENAAGKTIRNLGRLSFDRGTLDAFAPGPDGPVFALAVTTDQNTLTGVLYAGGDFDDVINRPFGNVRRNFVKVDADSGIAIDGGVGGFVMNPNGPVHSIAVANNNVVYVGGSFTSIRNVVAGTDNDVARLAAIDINGSQVLTDFAPGPDGGIVSALAHFPNRVLAGGSFPNIGNGPISNFASLFGFQFGTPTGNAVPNVPFPNGPALAITISADNKIYIGGNFTGLGGAPRGSLGALDLFTGQVIQ